MKKFFASLLIFLQTGLFPVIAAAVTRYVSPTGSTTNCTTMQTSSTPASSIAAVVACTSGGDTITMRGGTYTVGFDSTVSPLPSGGGEGSRTIVNVFTGETALIQPTGTNGAIQFSNSSTAIYITFDGGTNCGANSNGAACRLILDMVNSASNTNPGNTGANLGGASHVRLTNLEVRNAGNNGVGMGQGTFQEITNSYIHDNGSGGQPGSGGYNFYYGGGDDGLIENNLIRRSGGYGVHLNACNVNQGSLDCNGEDHTIHRAKIRFNDISASGQISTQETAGLLLGGFAEDIEAYGNVVHDNVGNSSGIQNNFFRPTLRNKIYNNTVTRNARAGIVMDSAQNATVVNNLVGDNNLSNTGRLNIETASQGTGNTYTTNGCFGLGGNAGGCNVTVTSTNFVNAAAGNFRLIPGSSAIDAGTVLGAPYNVPPYNVDMAGIARPQGGGYEIGAFEYGGIVTPPVNQLVLALPLDEGGGSIAVDVSGQKNNATLVGGATWDNAGKYGKAIALDGTGYLNIPASKTLALAPAMTLEAWIYPTAAFTEFATVIRQDRYFLYAASDAGYCPSVAMAPLGGYSTTVINVICGTSIPPLNQWSHLAVTHDGLTLTYYLNGNIVASQTSTDPMVPTSYNLTIGASQFGEYFIGKIDQPMVYTYARTRPQILSDMSTSLIGAPGKSVEIAAPVSVEIGATSSLEISAN